MKKQLVLIFAVLLILGFAASVYADTPAVASGDTQVTISGELRFRGRIEHDLNNTFDDDSEANATNEERARYDYKIRLGILAKVSPKTKMFLQLVSQNNSYNNHSYEAGKGDGMAKGQYTSGNNMVSALNVRNAWLEHTIADMITIKAGHQPIKLGWGLFYDHSLYGDDAIVVTVKPTKELSISALTSKLDENGRDSSDADLYALVLNVAPAKGTEISFDAAYLRDRYDSGLDSKIVSSSTNNQLALYNFGLRGKTKVAGLGLKLGAELQRGTMKDVTGATSDVKFRGMAATFDVSYDITPDVVLDAELMYGSGDKNGASDNKVKTFIASRSANTPITYVYEDTVMNAAGIDNGGIANTTFAKLGAKANLTKDLKVDLRYYYLRASNAVDAGTYGFTYSSDNKKDIGHEVDAYVTYKLDKGLVYFVEGGYLFAGDYWKAVTNTESPDNPWAVKHGLELEF